MEKKGLLSIFFFTFISVFLMTAIVGQAAVTFQARGTAGRSTGALTLSWPAHVINDVALLLVETSNQAVPSAPTGFIEVVGSPQGTNSIPTGTNTRLTVFWARATSSGMPNVRVSDSGNHQTGQIITFRGVITTGNPWDVTAGNVEAASDTSISIPGAMTTVADTLVVAISSSGYDITNPTAFSGWTNADLTGLIEVADQLYPFGDGGGFGAAAGYKAVAGTYGATTGTMAGASAKGLLSIALKPQVPDITPPITTAAPAGGTYTSVQNITLTCNDGIGSGCSNIYYTTDGSTPTTGSTVYSGAINISANTALKFFARDVAGNNENVNTEIYTIDTAAPATTAVPAGGTYTSVQNITLTCNDGTGTGCGNIYYTTDGSTPTTGSTIYSGAINLSTNTTLKFFASDMAGNNENVKTEGYTIDSTAPATTATPTGGAYISATNVTLTCNDGTGTGCGNIYYTTDGSTPTTGSMVYSGAINISANTTLNFFAQDMAGNNETMKTEVYTIDVTAPITTAAPAGGTYTSAQNVTLTCNDGIGTGCGNIYYTTDGSTPNTSSTVYFEAINISANTTLNFFAQDLVGNNETVKTEVYTIDVTAPATTAAPAGGTYTSAQNVTLTCNDGIGTGCGNIYYTTDGSTPTTGSTVYSGAINISANTTLNFFAQDMAGNNENVKTEGYTIDPTAPVTTVAPAGGTYTSVQNITLTCNDGTGTGCSNIYYTTDGSTPTTSSTVYSGAINISTNTTLKFFARDVAGNNEIVKTEVYTIDPTAPTTTATPAGGTYTSVQNVTLTCNDGTGSGCSNIYYTTNGSTPTTSSTVYSGAINISVNTTLKFFARDVAGNNETVKTEVYTIDPTAPVTTAAPAGGTYMSAQSVILTCNDGTGTGCGNIYYTTNGSTPTTSSNIYTAPIDIATTTTLKFFAIDLAGNAETVQTHNYTITIISKDIYLVWSDTTFGNTEVIFKKSTDGGNTWTPYQKITNNSGTSTSPSIAADGANIYLAWQDTTFGNTEILFKKSINGGTTWTAVQNLTNNIGNSILPDITINGINIYVAWTDDTYGNSEILFRKSTDGGATWTAIQRMTNNSGTSTSPSIAVYGANIYLAWQDTTFGNNEIFFKSSTDGGNTWTVDQRITNNIGWSTTPVIEATVGRVDITWTDDTFGNSEILFKNSIDGGNTWIPVKRATDNSGFSGYQTMKTDGTNIYLAWQDTTFGNTEIIFKKSTDGGNTWTGSTVRKITNNTGLSQYPSISIDLSNIYIIWQDDTLGNTEIFFNKSTDGGNTWVGSTFRRITNNSGFSETPVMP